MEVIDAAWIKSRLTGERGELTRLARSAGIGSPEISKILSGVRKVQPSEMPGIYAALGGGTGAPSAPSKVAMIDVIDVQASAGPGSIVETEDVVGRLSFPSGYLERITRSNPKHLRIIGVKGDSMDPTIRDDDVVMLDTSKTNLDYDGLFVLRFGDALHIKRVGRAPGNAVRIISDNKDFEAQDFPRGDVTVVGKVVWIGKKV